MTTRYMVLKAYGTILGNPPPVRYNTAFMGDTLIVLLFTAVILAFVSYLLYMRLGSAGVARGRITRAIAELWLTFALVILSFAIVSNTLGPPAGGIASSWEEIAARARALPPGLQALIGALLLASLLLVVHLMWSLQVLMREAEPPPPDDGGNE